MDAGGSIGAQTEMSNKQQEGPTHDYSTRADWKRLLPFFQLPGTITQDATLVQVELRPFNDHMLNRDLVILCDRVNQASPRLPDGRRLSFTIRSSGCILAAQQVGKIP